MRVKIRAIHVSDNRISTQIKELTIQAFQSIVDLLDLGGIDIADIGHQVSNVSLVIGNLLVDVVICKNFVH